MVVLEKYTGSKTYMFASDKTKADENAVLERYPMALEFTHIVHTNEGGETLLYLYSLSDMRSNYSLDSSLTENQAIAEIQRLMNLPPPEPEPDYIEFLAGMYEAVTGGSVSE